jgi:hypothetical protein
LFTFYPNDNGYVGKKDYTGDIEGYFTEFLLDKIQKRKLYDDLFFDKSKQIVNPAINPDFQKQQINRRFSRDWLQDHISLKRVNTEPLRDKRDKYSSEFYMIAEVTIKRGEDEYIDDQIVKEYWVVPEKFSIQNLIL